MRTKRNMGLLLLLLLLPLFFTTTTVFGQTGEQDLNFRVNVGVADQSRVLAVQPDGRLIVKCGDAYQGHETRGVARLNVDGTVDKSFVCRGTDGLGINAAAVQPDGKIVIAGGFAIVAGQTRGTVARLNSDGSLDTSFNAGASSQTLSTNYEYANCVALQGDGKILVGGGFQNFGNVGKQYLVRLNSNGTLDNSFAPALANFGDPQGAGVFAILALKNGNILVGGSFQGYIKKLFPNGTSDVNFVVPFDGLVGIDQSVSVIRQQSEGNFLLGGAISSGGVTGLLRINANGNRDNTFSLSFGGLGGYPETIGNVGDIQIEKSGKILIAGAFVSVNGAARNGLARLEATGQRDDTFLGDGSGPLSPDGTNGLGFPSSFYQLQNGKYLVFGYFRKFGVPATAPVRLNAVQLESNGALSPPYMGSTRTGTVKFVVPTGTGKIYIAGDFDQVAGQPRNRIARLKSDGDLDLGFSDPAENIPVTGDNGFSFTTVKSFAVDNSGNCYYQIGSGTTGYGTAESPTNYIKALDSTGIPKSGFSSTVSVAADGDQLYFAPSGFLVTTGGQVLGLNGASIRQLTYFVYGVFPDGSGLLGQSFSGQGLRKFNLNGVPDPLWVSNVPITFASRASFELGTRRLFYGDKVLDFNGSIVGPTAFLSGTRGSAFGVQGNKIYSLNTASSCPSTASTCNAIAEHWNGQVSSQFNCSILALENKPAFASTNYLQTPDLYDIAVDLSSNIYFGGQFQVVNGNSANGIVKLNGNLSATFAVDKTEFSLPPKGGTYRVRVFASDQNAPWSVTGVPTWITGTPPITANGSQTLALTVLPNNTSTKRSVDLTVAGKTVRVNQGGAPLATCGVYRPGDSIFYLRNQNTTGVADVATVFGSPGDIPVVGDWNGDGTKTIGIFRTGTFYLRNSNNTGGVDLAFTFGSPGDVPIVGDWDGDGVDTIGIYRNGTFFLRNSNSAGDVDVVFSLPYTTDDIPLVGDWNGDGVDTVGIYSSSSVFTIQDFNNSLAYQTSFVFGSPGDRPVVGDWNGDGIDTIGIVRNGQWLLRNSNSTGNFDIDFFFGTSTDTPIVGDWDGIQ